MSALADGVRWFFFKLLLVLATIFPFTCTFWLCGMPFIIQVGLRTGSFPPAPWPPPPDLTYTPGDANAWHRALPDCPCQLPATAINLPQSRLNWARGWSAVPNAHRPTTILGVLPLDFHPGAAWEVRWSDPLQATQRFDFAGFPSGQQCMYDRAGQLITGGIAAGTPDRWSFEEGNAADAVGHGLIDVAPYLPGYLDHVLGQPNSPRLRWYLDHWPPNQGAACKPCTELSGGVCVGTAQPPSSNGFPIGLVVTIGVAILTIILAAFLIGRLLALLRWLIFLPFRLLSRLLFRR